MSTMKDIADIANVSVTTVSNALTKKNTRVSPELREQIHKIANDMKYKPNQIASALAKKHTNIISILIDHNGDIEKNYYHSLIAGALISSSHAGYRVLLDMIHNREIDSFHLSRNEIYDGAIVQAPLISDNRINEMLDENIPFVVIGRSNTVNDPQMMFVDVDNLKIVYDITELLIQKGHRKIGFLNSMPNLTITFDRLSGYTKALADSGIPFKPSYVYNTDNTKVTGYSLGKDLLEKNPEITAVMVCSDDVAVGLYKVLSERNLNVGKDMSVFALGGDDFSDSLYPKLSNVKIDYFNIGKIASEMLIQSLKGKPPAERHVIVNTEYVFTDSF